MRVLAIGNMYPPHSLGGYELVWSSAMAHLRERGHQARVLTTDFRIETEEPDRLDTFRELRWYWRDHEWPRTGWGARLALERHNAAVLERHLAELRPDVVAWWAMGGMSLSLIERVRRAAIPAIAFVQDDWLLYGPQVDLWTRPFHRRPRLGAVAERLTGVPTAVDIEAAVRCVLVSETVRGHARAAGYALDDSSIVHSGIDPTYLDLRPERPWTWSLLYVGRLDERKGVIDAVMALGGLPEEATLTLVGAGDQRVSARLRELAARQQVEDRVRELGMRSRAELREIYAAADAVLFPVRWEEPWGLVPLEAMAVGRPVIATGRGGSGEYLRHEENCLLVPAAEPISIARAARRLASEPALRAQLRARGVLTARRYTETGFNRAAMEALVRVAGGRHAT